MTSLPVWSTQAFLEERNKHKKKIHKRMIYTSVLGAFCPPMQKSTAKVNFVFPKKPETDTIVLFNARL